MKKMFLLVCLLFTTNHLFAGDYSNWAVPTTVELVSGGVLLHGAFGDPNSCGKANFIFISQTDPSYDSVLSVALSALMGKREIRLYSSTCTQVGFHWTGEIVNQNKHGESVYIR